MASLHYLYYLIWILRFFIFFVISSSSFFLHAIFYLPCAMLPRAALLFLRLLCRWFWYFATALMLRCRWCCWCRYYFDADDMLRYYFDMLDILHVDVLRYFFLLPPCRFSRFSIIYAILIADYALLLIRARDATRHAHAAMILVFRYYWLLFSLLLLVSYYFITISLFSFSRFDYHFWWFSRHWLFDWWYLLFVIFSHWLSFHAISFSPPFFHFFIISLFPFSSFFIIAFFFFLSPSLHMPLFLLCCYDAAAHTLMLMPPRCWCWYFFTPRLMICAWCCRRRWCLMLICHAACADFTPPDVLITMRHYFADACCFIMPLRDAAWCYMPFLSPFFIEGCIVATPYQYRSFSILY